MRKSYKKRLSFMVIAMTLALCLFASDGWGAVPAAPTLSVENMGKNVVKLSWNSIDEADGYTLFFTPYPSATPTESKDMGSQTSFSKTLGKGDVYYVAVKAYNVDGNSNRSNVVICSGISLEIKKYDVVDRNKMIENYKKSHQYYKDNKDRLDKMEEDFWRSLSKWLSKIFGNRSLDVVRLLFYEAGLFTAGDALGNFLSATGANFPIDITNVIYYGGVSQLVYGNVLSSIDSDQIHGQIEIQQADWATHIWGKNAKWAYGTLKIDWETDGTDIVMFVDDIYSFDINEKYESRPTIPLYKIAGDLVLSTPCRASDFYFTGRTPRISISELRRTYSPPTLTSSVNGNTVTLNWSTVNGATGYNLYYGTSSGAYSKPISLGNKTSQTFSNIPSGTYYLAITAYNASAEIAKSNEVVVTVAGSTSLPNLTPYKPSGWPDKIVVSNSTGTNTGGNGSTFTTSDSLLVNYAIINNGEADVNVEFYDALYVDGTLKRSGYNTSLKKNYYSYPTSPFSIGQLSAGTHTIKIVADPTEAVSESDESDNSYSIDITINASSSGPTASPTSTSNGGGTWGSILSMSVSISGTTGTFTVKKQSGAFSTSGEMWVGIKNTNGGITGFYDFIAIGNSSISIPVYFADSDFSGYPREFWGYYYSDAGGYAYVGPITISWPGH